MKKTGFFLFPVIGIMATICWWPQISSALALNAPGTNVKPTNSLVTSNDLSKIQAQIDVLKQQLSSLNNKPVLLAEPDVVTTTETSTSTTYVTNPMTTNLDVAGYRIGNYSSSSNWFPNMVFDSDAKFIRSLTAPAIYVSATSTSAWAGYFKGSVTMGDFSSEWPHLYPGLGLSVYGGNTPNATVFFTKTSGENSTAAAFYNYGNNSKGLSVLSRGIQSRGVEARSESQYGMAISGEAGRDDAWAGYFSGKVAVVSGNLDVDNDIHVGTAIPGKLTVMDNVHGGIAFSSVTSGNAAKAGFFRADGYTSTALYAVTSSTSALAGYFGGKVKVDGAVEIIAPNPNNIVYSTALVAKSSEGGVYGSASDQDDGYGVIGTGHTGVLGFSSYPGGAGIYGKAGALEGETLAGLFEGEVKISGGNLQFGNNMNPRLDVVGPSANSLAIAFPESSGGYGWNSINFIFKNGNKLGIGTDPTKELDIKTPSSTNAEIALQTGNNIHWGMYQEGATGNLNFWHGDNRVTFSNRGVETKGLCLNGTCITSWKDLKNILSTVAPEYLPNKQ